MRLADAPNPKGWGSRVRSAVASTVKHRSRHLALGPRTRSLAKATLPSAPRRLPPADLTAPGQVDETRVMAIRWQWVGIVSLVLAATVSAFAAEPDHLLLYRAKDLDGAKPQTSHALEGLLAEHDCRIRGKSRLLGIPSIKDEGDDPRGGALETAFVCYRVTCTDAPLPDGVWRDGLAERGVRPTRPRFLCAPADSLVCGDGELDPGEECDGDAAGGGCVAEKCRPDCSCAEPVCGDGILDVGEACDGEATGDCDPVGCNPDCTCPSSVCGDGVLSPGEECEFLVGGGACSPLQCGPDCTCLNETCPDRSGCAALGSAGLLCASCCNPLDSACFACSPDSCDPEACTAHLNANGCGSVCCGSLRSIP